MAYEPTNTCPDVKLPPGTITAYPPTLTPLPVVDFIRQLQRAVVLSADDDKSHSDTKLARLQNRVLLAIARFECEMGGVL